MIIHIKYVKPPLTRGLAARDCGGSWAGAHFSLPSGPALCVDCVYQVTPTL